MSIRKIGKKLPPFIFIVLAAICSFCAVCVIGSSVMDALGLLPTSTPTFLPSPVPTNTSLPTNTSSPKVTDTPSSIVTNTPSPEVTKTSVSMFDAVAIADYPRVATSRFHALQAALNEFIPLHQQFVADISLAADKDWRDHTSATLLRVETGIHEIASMKNFPPQLAAFNQIIVQLDKESQLLSSAYTLALENQDVEALNRSNTYLSNMIVYVNQANSDLNSSIATVTPVATYTRVPTLVVVPVVPTNPPAAGGPCSCSGDALNCGDFSSYSSANACFNYCISVGAGDIHRLDGNNDGSACDSLR